MGLWGQTDQLELVEPRLQEPKDGLAPLDLQTTQGLLQYDIRRPSIELAC